MFKKIFEMLGRVDAKTEAEVIVAGDAQGAGANPTLAIDERSIVRFGLLTLLFGFGGFILWSALAPLDEGVPGVGVVVVDSKRKTIQHLKGGIVESIEVREGARVAAGDVLLRLNDKEIKAQLEIARGQYWTVKAIEARLLAERDNVASVKFPVEMAEAAKGDPRVMEAMRAQTQLFLARRSALQNELGSMEESISGLREQIRGLDSVEAGKKKQIDLLESEVAALRGLVEEGFVPRNKLYELERILADLSGTRGNDLASIARARTGISEIQLRKSLRLQDFRKEVEAQITDAQRDVGIQLDRLTALTDEFERTVIRAPASGSVVGLEAHTIGGVIRPGDRIMDIVPEGDVLIIEAQLPVSLIDKVQVGQLANVHFQIVMKGGKQPAIQGKLIQVSADRLTEQRSGVPYYSARIQITPAGESELKLHNMTPQAGMQTDVVIVTGERTVLEYLMRPLMSRMVSGMKEI